MNTLFTLFIAGLLFRPLILAFVPVPVSEKTKPPLSINTKGRYIFFDTIRGIAITAVVVIHVIYLFPLESYPSIREETLDAGNALLRFALPLFFIASGILLTPPKQTLSDICAFYKRQLVRVALPYLLVLSTLLFLRSEYTLLNALKNFFTGDASVPYYFVAVILQLYVLYPFIAHLAEKRRNVYLAFGFSLFSLFIPPIWIVYGVTTFFPFLFFFVWGIYMRSQILTSTVPRQYWPWASFIALYLLGYLLFPGKYFNVVYFFGTSVFMLSYLLITDNRIPEWFTKVFSALGGIALWVYLIHFPLQETFLPYVFRVVPSGWVAFILSSIVSVVVSAILAYGINGTYQYATKNVIKLFYTKTT
jgi:peptidoglycan/LPS O-acetylase OafA/YrhL